MSIIVIPSVSTMSGAPLWVISRLLHWEGNFSRMLAFHPNFSGTWTYCLSYPHIAIMRVVRISSSNVRPETYFNQVRSFWYHSVETHFTPIVLFAWFHAFVAEMKSAVCQSVKPKAALMFRKRALVTKALAEGNELCKRDTIARYRKKFMSICPKELILWRDLSKMILKKSWSHLRK